MDIKLEKKKGLQKKHIPYVLGGALFLVLLGWIIFGDHSSTLRVDSRGISIGNVTQGMFNDFVRIDGRVQPITVVQLSPQEGGIVEEKVIEEGTQVKKGDVIVRLSNSSLELSILESEARLTEQMNILRQTQINMQQQKLDNESTKLQTDLDMERSKRTFQQYEKLYNEELISREEYLKAKEDYEFSKRKNALITERILQDSIYRTIQVDQMEENVQSMQQNMNLIRQRRENLNVRSQIDGELGLLSVVLGQNISAGQMIGQINDLSDFKVELNVDEHYIDRVRDGLNATFERQGSTFNLVIRRVFPEVREGKFRTELLFVGERPDNIRSGQTYYVNVELGQPTEGILIPKGTFFQHTGGSWIFVLDKDGKKAHRRAIRIGRQNPQYYEVLEGLEAGERVIVSSYENYKNNEVLILE